MKLIIDIPEPIYDNIKDLDLKAEYMRNLIEKGNPLDKIREAIRIASMIEIDGDLYVRIKNVYEIFDWYTKGEGE